MFCKVYISQIPNVAMNFLKERLGEKQPGYQRSTESKASVDAFMLRR